MLQALAMATALHDNGKVLRNGWQTALIADDDSVVMQWMSPSTRVCVGVDQVPEVNMAALGDAMAAYLPCTVGLVKLLHLLVFPALAVFSYFFLRRVTMTIGLCTLLEIFLGFALLREYLESRQLLIILHNGMIVGRGSQWQTYAWPEVDRIVVNAKVIKSRRFRQELTLKFIDGSEFQIVTQAKAGSVMAEQALRFANLVSTASEMSKRN